MRVWVEKKRNVSYVSSVRGMRTDGKDIGAWIKEVEKLGSSKYEFNTGGGWEEEFNNKRSSRQCQ